MEINYINIQIPQAGSLLSPAGNGDTSPKRRPPVSADSENAGGNQAEHKLNSLTNTNFVKQQIQTILTSFPPYFPAGSPQRIDLIKGVKGVQEEIKNSGLPKEVKDKLAGQKLTDTATDKEIHTALKGVQHFTEDYYPNPSDTTNKSKPVEIVNITV